MDPAKYALLIRRAAQDAGVDLGDMSDEEIIYFYENTLWGTMRRIATAGNIMANTICGELNKIIDRVKGAKGGGE